MSDLKAYYELDCENLDIISSKVLNFISTDLASGKTGWIFLDTKSLLLAVPELMIFFKKLKLYPMEASITVLYDDMVVHVDSMTLMTEILDQSKAIVFNSALPHSVIKLNPIEMPRVVPSVTFYNEPLELLK